MSWHSCLIQPTLNDSSFQMRGAPSLPCESLTVTFIIALLKGPSQVIKLMIIVHGSPIGTIVIKRKTKVHVPVFRVIHIYNILSID